MLVPNGSKIKSENLDGGSTRLSWFRPNGGVFRYFIGVFLIVWLGMWVQGFQHASGSLLNPKTDASGKGFLSFWIIGWTIGGIFASYFAYLILRPQKPESITFNLNDLDYDSGTTTPVGYMFNMRYQMNPFQFWKDAFRKRFQIKGMKRGELEFILEKNPSRIYFDKELQRIEIGSTLTEPEIEWLHTQLEPWSKTN